jgi:hypothetical protein
MFPDNFSSLKSLVTVRGKQGKRRNLKRRWNCLNKKAASQPLFCLARKW